MSPIEFLLENSGTPCDACGQPIKDGEDCWLRGTWENGVQVLNVRVHARHWNVDYGRGNMPSYVLKAERGQDRYVIWSEIVEAPLAWGDTAEITAYLLDHDETRPDYSQRDIVARIARANEQGSSAIGYQFGYWDDTHLIFEQRGLLPRNRLWEFCQSYDETTERFDLSLLEAFDDRDGVRQYASDKGPLHGS